MIFVVVYPSGGLHSTTLSATEAADRAVEIRGLYGELVNVQDFRNLVERELHDVVPPEVAAQIEDFLAHPERGVRRTLRRHDS